MIWYIALLFFATLLGYKTISGVPGMLHTPLMSGMNALSGITVLGAFVSAAGASAFGSILLGALAVLFATVNIVAGFLVTHRMLRMFRSKSAEEKIK
jgi:NAD(P) transhydrogenase subunit alpha